VEIFIFKGSKPLLIVPSAEVVLLYHSLNAFDSEYVSYPTDSYIFGKY
jgi:hypothetical protein